MAQVDLATILAASDLTIAPIERDDERSVRLINEKRATLLADIRGMILFVVVLGAVLTLTVLCGHVIFFEKSATAETQRWAQTAMTALVSGGIAFLFGRSVSSK